MWQIDLMGLVLQFNFQSGSLLKEILEGFFFLNAFRQGGWRNMHGTRHVAAISPLPLAKWHHLFCQSNWRYRPGQDSTTRSTATSTGTQSSSAYFASMVGETCVIHILPLPFAK